MKKIHNTYQKYLLSKIKLSELKHLKSQDIENLRDEMINENKGYAFISVSDRHIKRLQRITGKLDRKIVYQSIKQQQSTGIINIVNAPITKQVLKIFVNIGNEEFRLTKSKEYQNTNQKNQVNKNDKQSIPSAAIVQNPAAEFPHIDSKNDPAFIAVFVINGEPMLSISPKKFNESFNLTGRKITYKDGKDIAKSFKYTIQNYFKPVQKNGIIIFRGSGKLTDPLLDKTIPALMHASPPSKSKFPFSVKDKNNENRDVLLIRGSPANPTPKIGSMQN